MKMIYKADFRYYLVAPVWATLLLFLIISKLRNNNQSIVNQEDSLFLYGILFLSAIVLFIYFVAKIKKKIIIEDGSLLYYKFLYGWKKIELKAVQKIKLELYFDDEESYKLNYSLIVYWRPGATDSIAKSEININGLNFETSNRLLRDIKKTAGSIEYDETAQTIFEGNSRKYNFKKFFIYAGQILSLIVLIIITYYSYK